VGFLCLDGGHEALLEEPYRGYGRDGLRITRVGSTPDDAFTDAAAILWPTRCKRRRSVQNPTGRGPAPDTGSRP
jgi:hypothetical protein